MDLKNKLERNDIELDKLGKQLLSEFNSVENKRRTKELEWTSALRQIKGIYDPEVLKNIPEDCSKIFIKYTKAKERYVRSKINSIVFPEKGKSWKIKPTPIPEVSEDVLQTVENILRNEYTEQVKSYIAQNRQPPPFSPSKEKINKLIMDISRKRCEKLDKKVEDQLVEANYKEVLKKVIKSGIRYGTGIWKGPMSTKRKLDNIEYVDNHLQKKSTYIYQPSLKFVPIWNFYPDMSVTESSDLSFIFELHCLNKKDLLNLAKQKGFYKDKIYKYINEHPTGDYVMKNWEVELMTIDPESKTNTEDKPMIKAYQVLEYWGYIDGTFFKHAGIEDADKLEDYEVYSARVWILGDKVIKISLNPLPYNEHPYNIFYFEKDETSIFGTGLPIIVEGTQEVINASARMMLDNAAIVAGPQMEVNLDLLDRDQDVTSVHPRKIWYRTGLGVDAQYPAIRSINLDSHLAEYVNILEVFRKLGDEESSIPSVLWTNLQTNETARGVLIRYKTAHITLMDIIKELDSAVETFLHSMVKWNFEFIEDESIKGDYKVEVKGTDILLEMESKLDSFVGFMKTLSPEDDPYLDRRQLLKERLKLFGIDDEITVRTEEEAQERMAQQQAMAQQMHQLEIEMIKAKADYEKAKAANMLAKSKKTLTEDDIAKKKFVKEILNDAESKANELITNPERQNNF